MSKSAISNHIMVPRKIISVHIVLNIDGLFLTKHIDRNSINPNSGTTATNTSGSFNMSKNIANTSKGVNNMRLSISITVGFVNL